VAFAATVIHIADEAEFTPRNVQTVEGRRATVYAVKLDVLNPEGKLKPGMPADVTFTRN
jgi:HlyD family secretion protein